MQALVEGPPVGHLERSRSPRRGRPRPASGRSPSAGSWCSRRSSPPGRRGRWGSPGPGSKGHRRGGGRLAGRGGGAGEGQGEGEGGDWAEHECSNTSHRRQSRVSNRRTGLGCRAVATRILSIDGGGIRGLIPALVLAHIEEQCGKPAAELFDVIAGTSTGGILALGLACPEPTYSARDLAGLYVGRGRDDLPQAPDQRARAATTRSTRPTGWRRCSRTGWATPGSRTRAQGAGHLLRHRAARTRVLPQRSGAGGGRPRLPDARRGPGHVGGARPTSSPPGCPATRRTPLVDGGVFANNPGMCAYVDRHTVDHRDDVTMVSLGTGRADPAGCRTRRRRTGGCWAGACGCSTWSSTA